MHDCLHPNRELRDGVPVVRTVDAAELTLAKSTAGCKDDPISEGTRSGVSGRRWELSPFHCRVLLWVAEVVASLADSLSESDG
jgi:hypothetical protein